MRFQTQRETLLRPLAQIIGVVERRQTMPVLSNVLIRVADGIARFTATDLEVELQSRASVDVAEPGEITVSARKLFDLVRALPDGVKCDLKISAEKAQLSAGRSRYTLAVLSAADFPSVEMDEVNQRVSVSGKTLKELLERTSFAMANQDVRYYLNGLLLELRGQSVRTVATDGHRLALCDSDDSGARGAAEKQVIVPRKGILELLRLLSGDEESVTLEFGRNHVRVAVGDTVFTSKLIDGRFPDYEAVIPIGADKEVKIPRDEFREALQRAAILSNEKYRGIKVEVSPGQLRLVAHNPEQEEAVEELAVETSAGPLNLGFNVNYLLDAINALDGEDVLLCLRDGGSSALIRMPNSERLRHVVMPLRL
jgi:DNA polymerase III subunit beta